VIWCEGLSRSFGEHEAVVGVDLDIDEGEVFGFLGPNGAGKTTTTRMLTTLLEPDTGEARVAGYDPVTEPLEVRRRIGYVPDELPVYERRTAREFLRLFAHLEGMDRREANRQAETLLERVGLPDVAGKPVGQFSKGMKQRLGLARALLGDPEVLFLDEPASGLDPMGQREIRSLIKETSTGGVTVFLCSHDLPEVEEVCQRVAVIRDGRIVREQALDRARRTVIRLEVDGQPPTLRERLTRLPNLHAYESDGEVVRVTFEGPVDRRDVARAAQEGGAILLDIEEEQVDLERIYEDAVVDGDATRTREGPP
jgi:ABC-2 type transport system ATP-binding protein